MSLEAFGVTCRKSLRQTIKNQHGEIACPVCSNPVGYTDDLIEVPVSRLADDKLEAVLDDRGQDSVRSRGYQCHTDDLLLPRTVSGRNAADFASSTWTGVRAEFGDGTTHWIPVLKEDLPDVPLDEIDTTGGRTRVGLWMEDDCDVYAGRANGGENHLLNTEPGERGWLGNPFTVDEFGREQAIAKYTHAVLHRCERDVEFRNALGDLQGDGVVLGCWCRRLEDDEPACHCDVLVRLIDDVLTSMGDANGGDRP